MGFIIRRFGILILAFLAVEAVTIAAEKPTLPPNYPALQEIDASKPYFAAYLALHKAALSGDFNTFKSIDFYAIPVTEDFVKANFAAYRSGAPERIKIGDFKDLKPKALFSEAYKFTAVGCKNGARYISGVTVGKVNGVWRVSAESWSDPWNDSARICPV